MILTFRRFRSRAGKEERALSALRKHAVAMIRDRAVEAVALCQRADLPQDMLWVHQQLAPRFSPVDGEQCPPSIEPDLVEFDGPAVRAEFVDGAYQFPLPPCRVWLAESSDERIARTLVSISRLAASDRRVCGVSAYRTVEVRSRLIIFFALALGVMPDDYFKAGPDAHTPQAVFAPVRVSWTVGRLAAGTPSAPAFVRYPSAAFWARGLVSPSQTTAITTEQVMEPSGSEKEPKADGPPSSPPRVEAWLMP
jgi:hypothetical protein